LEGWGSPDTALHGSATYVELRRDGGQWVGGGINALLVKVKTLYLT